MSVRPMQVVVLDDSPVFAMFATNAVKMSLPGASVVQCATYSEATAHLRGSDCGLIVCGYGVGEDMTAHDIRSVSSAPMVLLTGRPLDGINLPANSHLVMKHDGPDALRAAIGAAVAG